MKRERLTWRTFLDDGSLHNQWNNPATPSYVIIDHKGVIRRKWIGKTSERAIDTALESFLSEIE